MARKVGPFDNSVFYEVENRRLQKAFNRATGFLSTTQGQVTAGSGAQLVIAAYADGALIDGMYVENPTTETVTITTNTASTNPRVDRLVLRLDMSAKTIAPFQIVGTPAASPQAPAITQTATVFDLPLCRYTFPGSGSAQNPSNIVDERLFLPSPSGRILSRFVQNTASGDLVSGAAANLVPAQSIPASPFGSGVPYQLKVDARVQVVAPSGAGAKLEVFLNGVLAGGDKFGNGGGSATFTLKANDPAYVVNSGAAQTVTAVLTAISGTLQVSQEYGRVFIEAIPYQGL